MKKILNKTEITKFLDEYCPGLTVKQSSNKMRIDGYGDILREVNGSEASLKLIAYEYAFVAYATEKFERIEFPTHIYRLHTEPCVEFTLSGQTIQCDAYVPLARDEQDEFEITLDKGVHISGLQLSTYFDYIYQVTISSTQDIDPLDSVEDIQEQARDLVDEMLDQLSKYELRK